MAGGARPDLPRLHPNLTEVYCERVERLRETLATDRTAEVVEAVRALIERVEVNPPLGYGHGPRIELVGHLASLLRAAGVGAANAKSPPAGADGLDVFLSSELVDAGTRYRRCQYISVAI
jgi:hypothetical protein